MKLFDSELKVMEVLWSEGEAPAKKIAEILKAQIGWNKNTTYTVIKKCIAKGAVSRTDPHFICKPLIPKTHVQESETTELINKMFDGSVDLLFSSLLNRASLSPEDLERLKKIIADNQ